MAQRTVCFRSDAGTDFATEHEALVDDLRHYISGVLGNAAVAKQLTEAIVADLSPRGEWVGFASLMASMERTRPAETIAMDLQPVTIQDVVQTISAGGEIPPYVYYSAAHNNFFDAMTGKGKGTDFHIMWGERRDEFPTSAAPFVMRDARPADYSITPPMTGKPL
jgi:hypothetical protein